jgi:hypothetical protein
VNTVNRVLWIVVGVVLLAAGVVGTLASLGRLGVDPDTPVLATDAIGRWRQWSGGWVLAVAIAAALLVALLGLLLVRAELRGQAGPTMPDLLLEPQPPAPDAGRTDAGRTVVAATALDHALSRDLQAHRRVRRAAAHLSGKPNAATQLHVRLAVTPDADLTELQTHLDHALLRLADTSGVRPNRREVVVTMGGQQPGRVT